ncbi:tRNA uridine-5-carboxymethylaminomethyl(34) synthesis GTPase MnmE [Plastorhodobacter daqingensis]|uniref:tRNA modification GTPase MnmE n=1 Tax=Plastorhodobacter daqingensis TaxID=1387281 RepID=A0ABW2UGJ0_9RHOB
MDTIFALATARGKAGVAVVRLSGPDAWPVVETLAGTLPTARRAALRTLRNREGEVLDQALVILFPRGQSYTGEEVAELQLHGSPAIIRSVLAWLDQQPGLRPAEAGEFSRRALENGCMDLAQIEGLADLLEAETEAQRQQAQRVFAGEIGQRSEKWRSRLVRAAALLEATIDFADEDVPVDVAPEVSALIAEVQGELRQEVAGSYFAERVRDGFEVAILGAPNAGKSTLLNALARREAAITSAIAGTTRDIIEVRMDLDGLPVTFLDTAGLRDTEDEVEALGISRALARADSADLRILLVEGEAKPQLALRPDDLVVRGKADLAPGQGLSVSGKTGEGLQELTARITQILSDRAARPVTLTRARHRRAAEGAISALDRARDQLEQNLPHPELAAEELRSAIRALNALVGRVDVEDLLDEIFSSFCIGK